METDSREPRRYMLERSGKKNPPLVFQGILIAEVVGPIEANQKRWHDLRLYRTEHNHVVIEIVFQTRRTEHRPHHAASLVDNLTEAREAFERHDPLINLGFPRSPKFDVRVKEIGETLIPEYHERVDTLFKSIIEP